MHGLGGLLGSSLPFLLSNSYSPFRAQPRYHFLQEALPQTSAHWSYLKNGLFDVHLPSQLQLQENKDYLGITASGAQSELDMTQLWSTLDTAQRHSYKPWMGIGTAWTNPLQDPLPTLLPYAISYSVYKDSHQLWHLFYIHCYSVIAGKLRPPFER